MNIHEYQAKELLKQQGLPVLAGQMVDNLTAVETAADDIKKQSGQDIIVMKAQIHAGGRGAGHFQGSDKGGVRVIKNHADIMPQAESMLGKILITKQTGEAGKKVKKLYLEAGVAIKTELYLSLLVNRNDSNLMFLMSSAGGMDIEEVADKTPEKIIKQSADDLSPAVIQNIGKKLQLPDRAMADLEKILPTLLDFFIAHDCSLIEINPLIVTEDDRLVLLDAKMSFDDNGLFRHPALAKLYDADEEEPMEALAKQHDLNYIKLDGTIGCMVNGAGLAMATMDIIKQKGAYPANFLDVGGGATAEKVSKAFEIILSDSHVKGILVNIFGGIMRCDIIANGIITALKQHPLSVPLVVRLEGTNVEEGKKLLAGADFPIITADDLADAAEKIVKAVGSA